MLTLSVRQSISFLCNTKHGSSDFMGYGNPLRLLLACGHLKNACKLFSWWPLKFYLCAKSFLSVYGKEIFVWNFKDALILALFEIPYKNMLPVIQPCVSVLYLEVTVILLHFIYKGELTAHPRIILRMCPANGRWHYNVTSSFIGWAHTQNDPCYSPVKMRYREFIVRCLTNATPL